MRSKLIILTFIIGFLSLVAPLMAQNNNNDENLESAQLTLPSGDSITTEKWLSSTNLFSGSSGNVLFQYLSEVIAESQNFKYNADVVLYQAGSLSSGSDDLVTISIELEKGLTFRYYIALIYTLENRWKMTGSDAIQYIKSMFGISMTQANDFYNLPKSL
jgi:hypothetical protein